MIHRSYQIFRFWRSNGSSALYRLIRAKLRQPDVPMARLLSTPGVRLRTSQGVKAKVLYDLHFEACSPLRVFSVPDAQPSRISLVTDSIGKGSLYGGVGTAIILSVVMAEKLGARLRIITRTTPADAESLAHVLSVFNLKLSHEVELVFAPFFDHTGEVDLLKDERFITTSWWTTVATMASVPTESIVYLLQEDERKFYPYGDDFVRCESTLKHQTLRYVVNSHLLFNHLLSEGFENIAAHGICFEPAFPRDLFYPRLISAPTKRKLMFYARPNNLRNLFYFGIELLEAAILQGIINLDQWEILLVGKDIPRMVFADGYVPQRKENLSWEEYAELVGSVDLGLCLMSTPHPSYPPLDLAVSGAVVVTNRFRSKVDLSGYSENILCGDLDLESMLSTLARGIRLSENDAEKSRNYRAMNIPSDWRHELEEVVAWIVKEV